MPRTSFALLATFAVTLPAAAETAARPPTRKFEIRKDRATLGGHEIRMWGIRGANAPHEPGRDRALRAQPRQHGRPRHQRLRDLHPWGATPAGRREWGARNGFENDGRLKPSLRPAPRVADPGGGRAGHGHRRRASSRLATSRTSRARRPTVEPCDETARFLKDAGLRNVFVDLMHEYGAPSRGPRDLQGAGGGRRRRRSSRPGSGRSTPTCPLGVCADHRAHGGLPSRARTSTSSRRPCRSPRKASP